METAKENTWRLDEIGSNKSSILLFCYEKPTTKAPTQMNSYSVS